MLTLSEKNCGLSAGILIFGSVGLLHLSRLITGSAMVLGGHNIPVWASGVFLVMAWAMAGWYFYLLKK